MRVVSLVPSLTETLAALGVADRLVAATRYCVRGAPPGCRRVGGTKNPDLDQIVRLAPDLVLANAEENRPQDVGALREAGLQVHVSYPRTVDDVAGLLAEVAGLVGGSAAHLDRLLDDLDAAAADADAARPAPAVPALVLVWRKPWMGAGPGTYVHDLLGRCGFANVLAGRAERYPRLTAEDTPRARVVLLPSEPYAFTEADLPPLHDWLGAVPHRFVDGQLLTWHGPSTAAALRVFSGLAAELAEPG